MLLLLIMWVKLCTAHAQLDINFYFEINITQTTWRQMFPKNDFLQCPCNIGVIVNAFRRQLNSVIQITKLKFAHFTLQCSPFLDMQASDMSVFLAVFCAVSVFQLCHGVSSSGECYFNAKGKLQWTLKYNQTQILENL